MTDLEQLDQLPVPGVGTVVDLNNEAECVLALADVRALEEEVKHAKRVLSEAIADRARVLGTKTLHLENGLVAIVSRTQETRYDAEAIEQDLRSAGMPEERIREIVEETVSYKVKAVEAKRAAGANPVYDRIISEHAEEIEKPVYISIKGR